MCVDVFVCGCFCVWMSLCVDVFVCGCQFVWMSLCVDVFVCGCQFVWMSLCGCHCVWMSLCVDVIVCGCLFVWMSFTGFRDDRTINVHLTGQRTILEQNPLCTEIIIDELQQPVYQLGFQTRTSWWFGSTKTDQFWCTLKMRAELFPETSENLYILTRPATRKKFH
jgi:hypothetical protein